MSVKRPHEKILEKSPQALAALHSGAAACMLRASARRLASTRAVREIRRCGQAYCVLRRGGIDAGDMRHGVPGGL